MWSVALQYRVDWYLDSNVRKAHTNLRTGIHLGTNAQVFMADVNQMMVFLFFTLRSTMCLEARGGAVG